MFSMDLFRITYYTLASSYMFRKICLWLHFRFLPFFFFTEEKSIILASPFLLFCYLFPPSIRSLLTSLRKQPYQGSPSNLKDNKQVCSLHWLFLFFHNLLIFPASSSIRYLAKHDEVIFYCFLILYNGCFLTHELICNLITYKASNLNQSK